MISLFLLIVAAIVLVLGYRFYSKLLALWVFGLQANYSTPAYERADDIEFFATSRHHRREDQQHEDLTARRCRCGMGDLKAQSHGEDRAENDPRRRSYNFV